MYVGTTVTISVVYISIPIAHVIKLLIPVSEEPCIRSVAGNFN